MKKTVYLDYASTTPTDPQILEKMISYFGHEYSNPSSMHTSGRQAKVVIENARKKIAECINANPDEIIFTGSGTESDNMAIKGVAMANKSKGNHIIISAVEHKAVLESAKQLEREGFEISILPVDKYGMIDIGECLKMIKKETILISVMYANNEIGTIEPIKELAKKIREYREESQSTFLLFHTDACQTAGYLSIDVKELGIDLMTLNSSKVYGPKGIGLLYKRTGIKILPIISGGEQEKSLRAGTENIALIFGFSRALEQVQKIRVEESERLKQLQKYFIKGLQKKIPSMILNGHPLHRLPNNVHISIPTVEGESLILMLDRIGIEASTGSACSAFDLKPSHVLIAIKQNEEIMHGSIRFTFGKHTTKKELDYVLKEFPPIVKKLSKMSAIRK
ncbi:MAG TPA: cysteine desulfurase family protein [Candidatus Paceibacterota bacterium]